MIIDIHCHLMGPKLFPTTYWEYFVESAVAISGASAQKVRERFSGWFDLTGDMLVKDMDEAGIDKAVLLPLDITTIGKAGAEEEEYSIRTVHEIYNGAVKRHPERLILFAGINAKRPRASSYLQKLAVEMKVRGLKLHPSLNYYYANEPCAYRLYEKCEDLGIPVLVHTGVEPGPGYAKYALPIHIDEVATDFPDLKIIMAHVGSAWWQEAIAIAQLKPNVYVDLAMCQTWFLNFGEKEFYRMLRQVVNVVGPSRVLFGSDWPTYRQVRRMNHVKWVSAIREIPESIREEGIDFTKEELEAILGGNSARLLGL